MTHLALLCIALLFALCLVACYGWRRAERDRLRWISDYRIVVRDRDEHAREERRLRETVGEFHGRWVAACEERDAYRVENERLRKGGKGLSKWN